MNAEFYNRIRRILFSAAHDPTKGFDVAYHWLDTTYRSQLGPAGYHGLKAELNFYEHHGRDFNLTVAGDMGEHADFAGIFANQAARFDVTTNVNFKRFSTYEPYLGQGINYKIAVLDHGSFEVIDIFDLAFPRCGCGGGYLIPAIVMLTQNYDRHGNSRWTNDQLLVDVCASCECYFERNRFTHSGMFSPQEHYDALGGDEDDSLAQRATEQHVVSTYKYFRREIADNLMAIGSQDYVVTEPRSGDGHWAIQFNFVNRAVSADVPPEIECEPEL